MQVPHGTQFNLTLSATELVHYSPLKYLLQSAVKQVCPIWACLLCLAA